MTEDEYKSLERLVKYANRRLERLERFSGRDVSWAGKRLQSKIDNGKVAGWTDNRITINKNMSQAQLNRIEQATRDFMVSKASKISDVKNIIKTTTKNIGANLSVSKEQAETMYQMLTDDSFKYLKEHSSITSSEAWAVIQEAKEKHFTFKTFQQKMIESAEIIPDEEMKRNINSLFMREVLGY